MLQENKKDYIPRYFGAVNIIPKKEQTKSF